MAWTAPSTAVAGAIATAALWNSDVRDNTLELRATPAYRCVATSSGTQSVTAGNTDALTLDQEEVDTASMHSTSSNTDRVTIPSGGAGFYIVHGFANTAHSGAVSGEAFLRLRKNASSTLRQAVHDVNAEVVSLGANAPPHALDVLWMGVLVATDWVSLTGQAVTSNVTFGPAVLSVVGALPPS